MALSINDCARLTGQTVPTMNYFLPLRNIWNRVREFPRASTTAAGITWMSRYIYGYHRTMLEDLAPGAPATERWPLYRQPPPHFLIGYQYLVRTCNDYIFDSRAYSRLKYHELARPGHQTVNWSVMANCSYTINTGAYHRFVDFDDFQTTLTQIQQAILAERVVADLALVQPQRGFGLTRMHGRAGEEEVPVERLMQDYYKDLARCQDHAWGMADRLRIQQAGPKDLVLLATIRRLRTAYFNFITSSIAPAHTPPPPEETVLSLPCDCDWLEAFVQRFSDPVDLETLRSLRGVPTGQLIRCIVSALSLPNGDPPGHLEMRGGVFTLRPREDGRAVTETMRRRRGETIERFIDRLPVRRRRRRPPPPPPPPEEEVEEMLVDEEEEVEELPGAFEREVRATIAELIRLLEEDLTVSARNSQFFNFAVDFYEAMERLEALGDVSEMPLRRWIMYFFVTEHIATTLNYLYQRLCNYAVFARHVELNLAQVVMRARDPEGAVVYSRVWNEAGMNAFSQLMGRISNDLAATVERAGRGDLQEEEIEQFMTEIAYQDNSGDVQEILRQAAVNDTEIDSVELSFRFKLTGPVAFTQRRQIQDVNRRVVAHASLLRAQYQNLPARGADVPLPPLPPGPEPPLPPGARPRRRF
ncbi:E2B precursor terminal protein [Human mastadenovirus E]|uniref:Preterminal protein n=2 Tax=Human mastadenovirus E TaxID=130308 RepID=Q5VHB9_ADE04|nr:pTP [Human mastadenovirus E]AAS16293.2 E2B precursor terminal protein [Human adenovirus E4]AAS66918.1 pTP [Human mastadenovirus E]AAT97442.1 E2B precursor terminal protein [Human adenovirus E4]ANQ44108.1 terminal protein precursor pTP [Human adenovirus E4]ANQ44146.1 terminal protein precursor pTP [Human adenovirus E4]